MNQLNENVSPFGGVSNPDRFQKVQQFCDSIEDEMTGQSLSDLAIQFGYSAEQLAELKEFCFKSNIDIPRTKLPVLALLYSYVEQMKIHQEQFLLIKDKIAEQRKIALAGYTQDLIGEQKKVLDDFNHASAETASSLLFQIGAVEEMIQAFNPNSDLTERFAGSVLQGVSQGIQAQANTFNAGMNQALDEHINRITLENSVLKNQLFEVSGEVKKLQDLKVQDLVSPLSRELTLQMSTVTERASSYFSDLTSHSRMVVEKLSKDLENQANSVFKKLTDRNQQAQNVYDLNANAAANKFEEVVQSAEVEFVKLVGQVERTIKDRYWIERSKIWGGVAVISILTGPVMSYLLFFRHWKF